jgi:hypothetical protein
MVTEKETTMVRGKAIASIPAFVIKKFGKDGYKKWLDAISAEAYQVFYLSIKSEEWYPVKITMIDPSANVAQLFYEWDIKKAAWEMGRFSADYGLNNIRKLFVKMGPEGYLLKKSVEIINSYYKPVYAETSEITEVSGIIRIKDFVDMDKTVEFRMAGWMERALEISGCKNVKIEIPKPYSNSHPVTEFHISWE